MINSATVLTSPSAIIGFLDIIHYSVCYLKSMIQRLDSGSILRQKKPTQLGPVDRASSYLWTLEPTEDRQIDIYFTSINPIRSTDSCGCGNRLGYKLAQGATCRTNSRAL
jgi:hypothetical protein